jgi:four helix bundle protein
MKNFSELIVWQKAHQLTLGVYRVTTNFPKTETYGLTSQIRRASASIATNIAEGCGRSGEKDFAWFLHIAAGSANEVEYQLLLARDLNYLNAADYAQLSGLLNEVKRMLAALISKIRTHQKSTA